MIMKVFLSDQNSKFLKHLDFFKKVSEMEFDKFSLNEKITSIDINTNLKLEQLNLEFLFDYLIFPENILTFKAQWAVEDRRMKVGDTIVQQAYLPPVRTLSLKMVFGVRINEIIDQTYRKGFSYETLMGHVEKGISTFTVEQLDDKIVFQIQTFSTPGNFFSKLIGRTFTLPYQSFCTKKALKSVKHLLEMQS